MGQFYGVDFYGSFAKSPSNPRERYRDLLQASTSIITISTESKLVTTALAEVEEASQTENSTFVHSIPRKTAADGHYNSIASCYAVLTNGRLELGLPVLQSLSAHLKLLLDAPEQLWRLLEKHNYLHAAWLFLLSRVVYRSLTQDESQVDEDFEVSWTKSGIDVSVGADLAHLQCPSFIKHVGTIPAGSAPMGHNKSVQDTNLSQGYPKFANNESNATSEWLRYVEECNSRKMRFPGNLRYTGVDPAAGFNSYIRDCDSVPFAKVKSLTRAHVEVDSKRGIALQIAFIIAAFL